MRDSLVDKIIHAMLSVPEDYMSYSRMLEARAEAIIKALDLENSEEEHKEQLEQAVAEEKERAAEVIDEIRDKVIDLQFNLHSCLNLCNDLEDIIREHETNRLI